MLKSPVTCAYGRLANDDFDFGGKFDISKV